MKFDLDELERKAKAALHSGPTRYFVESPADPLAVSWSLTVDGRDTCVPQGYADCFRVVDAEHIAATPAPVVLALIARIRELESGLRILIDEVAVNSEDPEELAADRALLAKGIATP